MDVQATPSPYASLGAAQPAAGNPPALGQQVPGHTGGLPAQGGLSVLANPMAEELRSKGRGEDTMLVHMTPNEVNSLQGLAMAAGGSLTINPHTGLPEAGWLGKLLPTILGAVGMAFGIPPIWMGAAGAVGGTIATGDLGKGLAMGLQAYGGASLGGALGVGGKLGNVGQSLGLSGSEAIGGAAAKQASMQALEQTAQKLPGMEAAFGPSTSVPSLGAPSASAAGLEQIAQNLPSMQTAFNPSTAVPSLGGISAPTGFFGKFGEAAGMGLPGGIVGKVAPMLAAQGVMSGVSNAMTPTVKTAQEQTDNSYTGPYRFAPQEVTYPSDSPVVSRDSSEHLYFTNSQPELYNAMGQLVRPGSNTAPGTPILQNVLAPDIVKKGFLGIGTKTVKNANKYTQQWVPWMGEQGVGYAGGGEVELADGAFVVDARTVSELGNGSSNAGHELLAKMGGRPIRGPGDGVSDSIPARIGRDQPARVARDEVIFDPAAVRRIGNGDEKRGAQKLYAMMDKAHTARKRAGRGSDTKLRKGLA